MAVITYSNKTQGSVKVCKYITVKQMACKDGTDKVLISQELMAMIEKLYDLMNCHHIDVSSGYRTPSHDRAVGGNGKGQHTLGKAIDICFYNQQRTVISTKIVSCIAQDMGFTGIANINTNYTYIHLDVRSSGKYYGNEIKSTGNVTKDFYSYYNKSKKEVQSYIVGDIDSPAIASSDYLELSTASYSDVPSDLYSSRNDRNDAVIREIGYWNTDNKPSIKSSTLRASVVNYTSGLGALLKAAGIGIGTQQNMILDQISPTPREIIQFIRDKGLPVASAVGITANIFFESGYSPASLGDYMTIGGKRVPTSFGICQWHNHNGNSGGRGDKMKAYVGSDWATNLTGQLEYLWFDLTNNYKTLYKNLLNIVNTAEGARTAAERWCIVFEVPANKESVAVNIRGPKAIELWKQIVPQLTTNAKGHYTV